MKIGIIGIRQSRKYHRPGSKTASARSDRDCPRQISNDGKGYAVLEKDLFDLTVEI